ncbi:hypothetical protein ACFLZ7_01540 [Nanoarchaeota archaeon]
MIQKKPEFKVYLKGECFGLYGRGDVVLAVRDETPKVVKDSYYTIKKVVETEKGACARNLAVILQEVEGAYSRRTFRADKTCLEMKEKRK